MGQGWEKVEPGHLKPGGGESQKWLKAVIRCKPVARPGPHIHSHFPSTNELLIVALMGSFGSSVVTL